jgi:hypothetical protein
LDIEAIRVEITRDLKEEFTQVTAKVTSDFNDHVSNPWSQSDTLRTSSEPHFRIEVPP